MSKDNIIIEMFGFAYRCPNGKRDKECLCNPYLDMPLEYVLKIFEKMPFEELYELYKQHCECEKKRYEKDI